MSDLRDMCPDCQHPYSLHGHGWKRVVLDIEHTLGIDSSS